MKNLKLYSLTFNVEDCEFVFSCTSATGGVEYNEYSGVVSWSQPKIALRLDAYRVIDDAAYFVTDSLLDSVEIKNNLKDTLEKYFSKRKTTYEEMLNILGKLS